MIAALYDRLPDALLERLRDAVDRGAPLLVTLVLHAVLVYVVAHNWSRVTLDLSQPAQVPKIVNARLVELSQVRPKAAEKPPEPAPRPPPKAKPEPAPPPRAQPRSSPEPKPAARTQPEPQAKREPRPAEPEPALSPEELAASAREDIARTLAAEEEARREATAEELAASYAALIQRTVVNYWNRPPSARNDMEALLRVQLVPTGEVVSVAVVKSSGNMAFDRSAVNAVERAGRFPELQNLPPRQFEKAFRQFSLLFRPEDLRY